MPANRRIALLGLLLAGGLSAPLPCQNPGTGEFDRRTPVVRAVEKVGPSVVNIRTQGQVHLRRAGFFQRFEEVQPHLADRSLGSGVIIHPSGYAVTNEHVVRGADRILVALKDGRTLGARLINTNVDSDLAVLKIDGPGPFPVAELGDSDHLYPGETTIALGNPFGLDSSVTAGVLSGIGRSVRFRGREVFSDFLQTSAIINPGNSGGPLLDINGRVIGINVAIDNRGPGIGYAIPVNRVKTVTTGLLDPEITKHAWLGFQAKPAEGGLVVHSLVESSPASEAGLKVGDRIVAVSGKPVRTPLDLNVVLQEAEPDQTVAVRIVRENRDREVDIPFRAIPLADLLRGDRVRLFGISAANLTEAAANRLHLPEQIQGPIVLDVESGSGAEQIGVKPGDVIVQIEAVTVPDVEQMARVLNFYRQRGSARIKIYREPAGLLEGRLALDR